MRRRAVVEAETSELAAARLYGKHYYIRRYDDRPSGEQEKIDRALSAFRSFRRERGEEMGCDMWDMPPPDVDTLKIYIILLRQSSRPWRDASVAALRLYFLHIKEPELFRLTEAPLVRA